MAKPEESKTGTGEDSLVALVKMFFGKGGVVDGQKEDGTPKSIGVDLGKLGLKVDYQSVGLRSDEEATLTSIGTAVAAKDSGVVLVVKFNLKDPEHAINVTSVTLPTQGCDGRWIGCFDSQAAGDSDGAAKGIVGLKANGENGFSVGWGGTAWPTKTGKVVAAWTIH